MNREEHLRFCKICKNQKFDLKQGIICGLTDEKANFEEECPSFESNDSLNENIVVQKEELLDNSKAASITIKIFWAIYIVNLAAVISGYFQYDLLERVRLEEYFTEDEATMNDLRQGIIGIIQSILYLASIISFLFWFGRAYANLERNRVVLEYNKSMAVWSFFIPILSLFRPYTIAKEIAFETRKKAAELDKNTHTVKSFPMLKFWWALFLLTNWIGQFAFKSLFKDETLEQLITSTQAYMISDFLDIPAAIVTFLMIQQISKDEKILFNAQRF